MLPATLRKWPSVRNERVSTADRPYLILDGTLDECIRQFMARHISQHHLYEIHTAPQGELVSAILSARQMLKLPGARFSLTLEEGREVHRPNANPCRFEPTGAVQRG